MNQYILLRTSTRAIVLAFFAGIAFGGVLAYVWTDDVRIEQEDQQRAQALEFSQIVKAHYARECSK